MATVDLFCAPDDRHRVSLLTDLLEQAGQNVRLVSEPVAEPTVPCLVAWTRRAAREPWIVALFVAEQPVLAIRLDDTPLPGPSAGSVDMQTWPARSADARAGDVVRWLARYAPAGSGGVAESAAEAGPPHGAGGAASAGRSRRRRESNLTAVVVVLTLIGAGVFVLWEQVPDPGGRQARQQTGEAAAERPRVRERAPVPERPPVVVVGAGMSPDDVPIGTQVLAYSPENATVHVVEGLEHRLGADAEDPMLASQVRGTVQVQRSARPPGADGCRLAGPAAEPGWAGALTWQQRLQLARTPCELRPVLWPAFETSALAEVSR